jgi:hypothetical protein
LDTSEALYDILNFLLAPKYREALSRSHERDPSSVVVVMLAFDSVPEKQLIKVLSTVLWSTGSIDFSAASSVRRTPTDMVDVAPSADRAYDFLAISVVDPEVPSYTKKEVLSLVSAEDSFGTT